MTYGEYPIYLTLGIGHRAPRQQGDFPSAKSGFDRKQKDKAIADRVTGL